MTILEAMQTPLREILITGLMILLLLQGYLMLAFIGLDRKNRMNIAGVILFAVEFLIFFLALDTVFHYAEPEKPRTWPVYVMAFRGLPAALLTVFELICVAAVVTGFIRLRRSQREKLTYWAVKETIDLLPAGVAFAEEDGRVVLANLTMNRIAGQKSGRNIRNTELLPKEPVYNDGEKTWQFIHEKISEGGKDYLQVTATDITTQAKINEELKGKNTKLKEIKERLEIYNRTAEQLIISQELLNARMQVHNETGHVLLASRRYMDHPDAVDEAALLNVLQITNASLLREFEEDDTTRDPLTEAMEMARTIGVKVALGGVIPADGAARNILAVAINECATNARKHADGDLLKVSTEEQDGGLCIMVVSNGESADKKVSEGGGLSSLRTLVENAGGTMEICSTDPFTLMIVLKNGSRE